MHAGAFWTLLHVVSWSTYVGGTLVMEFIWRHAQQSLPPSQTAVACQWMGRRYRWIALSALVGAAVSGVARMVEADLRSASSPARVLDLSHAYGRTMVAVIVVWFLLVGLLGLLSLLAHPALHVRMSADMTDEERAAARQKVHRAIRRMDLLLRLELGLALLSLLLGSSLAHGGLA